MHIPYEDLSKGPAFGARHVQFILLFWLFVAAGSTRLTLPTAIIDMADIFNYNWETKNVILSSFYWGYLAVHLLGRKLTETFQTKWVLTAAVLFNSTVSVLIPTCAVYCGVTGIIICRVIQGVSEGLYWTSSYRILAQWTPFPELPRTLAILYSGDILGCIFTLAISGYISSSSTGYYLSGGMGVLWILPWIFLASNSPNEHKTITTQEKIYVQVARSPQASNKKIPWRTIFTSMPMIVIIISAAAKFCTDSLFENKIPMHVRVIMEFDVKKSGLLLAMSYTARFIIVVLGTIISDWMINNDYVSRTNTRKIFNSIGTLLPGICIWALGFHTNKHRRYIGNLATVIGTTVATYHGCMSNLIDVSPLFWGSLRGVTSIAGNLFALSLPLYADIIEHEEDPEQWTKLFIPVSCINIVAGILYNVFASGKNQRWSSTSKTKDYGTLKITDGGDLDESSL